MFIGRTDVEAETPILWPPDEKNWLTGKDSDAGKDWRWEEKGTMEDEMVGWHHQLNGHEFESAPEVGDGQGGLACCSPWGHKELDTTEWLNWTELAEPLHKGCYCLIAQLCPTLCNPMDYSSGSSVHGISQVRILEWLATSSSRGSSWSEHWTCISCIAGEIFTTEPPGKLLIKFESAVLLIIRKRIK